MATKKVKAESPKTVSPPPEPSFEAYVYEEVVEKKRRLEDVQREAHERGLKFAGR